MNIANKLDILWNKKYIYKSDIKDIDYSFLPDSIKNGVPRQIVWHLINKVYDIVECECGNPVKWITSLKCYRTFCSSKCSLESDKVKEKRKQTNIEKYGSENPFGNKEIQEKIKQTNLEKYGVEHPLQNFELLNKFKNTMVTKYGVENALYSDEFRQKIKQTNLERYGVEYTLLSPDIQEKIKQTNLERYGVDNPQKNKTIQEKTKKTNIEKYGHENPLLSEDIRKQAKKTNIEKYGHENPLLSPDIQEKIKQTNLERYGTENPFGSKEIQEKIKQTNFERYGVYYASQKHISDETMKIINSYELFCEFIKNKTVYEITRMLGIEETTVYSLIKKYELNTEYNTRGASYLEIEMKEFLDNNDILYIINDRDILIGKELDFYIPSYNLAIEMNGNYYHSDKFINEKKYHYNKWKSCKEQGIQLITIFEDDWVDSQDKVKNILLNKFNKNAKGVSARKTYIKQIKGKDARYFLCKYHLQGYVTGTHYGAFDNKDKLVGIMTFGKTRNGRFELKRFVTDNYSHAGLFSKMFHYAQKDIGFLEVVSFSDNTYFTGNVYNQNGFNFNKILEPDYRYLYNKKRIHKSNFSKKNIKQKFPDLREDIDSGMTEREAMELLNIPKIYDCGKYEWIWRKK